jgi:hypothetical protein
VETGKSLASRAALVFIIKRAAEELTIVRRESDRGNEYGWLFYIET